MARQILIAPTVVLPLVDGPMIYLNGPIQGTGDWQTEAITHLGTLAPDVHVASPRAKQFTGDPDEHLSWQTIYQDHAAQNGVLLVWLSAESKHRCNRAYAQQARFELAEWAVKSQFNPAIKLVVGIERGFGGANYLRRRFTLTFPHVPLCRTLRQTCATAADLLHPTEPVLDLATRFAPPSLFKP